MRAKLKALLAHKRMPIVATLVAIVLLLPVIGTGMMMDDHVHKMLISNGKYPGGPRGDWDIFRFLDDDPAALKWVVDRGMWPWWTAPGFRLAFFRPLASLWHSLDYHVFPNAHWFLHFESILIFAASAFFASVLYRRILGATVCAGLATLMFAVDDAHSMVITWIANRHSILAATCGQGSWPLCFRAGLACRRKWRQHPALSFRACTFPRSSSDACACRCACAVCSDIDDLGRHVQAPWVWRGGGCILH
jgi:hypothetical protein